MIAANIWEYAKQVPASIEVSDLLKEDGIGVVLSIKTAGDAMNVQLCMLDAAELIAALTNAVREQHKAMGSDYVRP